MLKDFCEDFDEKKPSFIFTLLKSVDPDDKSFELLYKKSKMYQEDKLNLYTHLFNIGILYKVYLELERYKILIEIIEKKITGNNQNSQFLKLFFEKLQYNIPIEPDKIKQILLLSGKKSECTL